MRSLFLMSLFGLFMIAATNGQSMVSISLVSSAYASDNDDENSSTTTSSNDDADSEATAATTEEAGLNCPDGITTCYSADGAEYTDVNNLEATAAGSEGESDDGEALVSVVNPGHFRSF